MNRQTRAEFSTRRCTMICATLLICYLFTCCTHLNLLTTTIQATATKSPPSAIDRSQNSGRTLQLEAEEPVIARAAVGSDGSSDRSGDSSSGVPSSSPNRNNLNQYNEVEFKDLKHDDVHKLMSEQDLRRTFQVDSHDQVPEYEILKLTVNEDGSHLISPISDLGELTTTTTTKTTKAEVSSKQHTSDPAAEAAVAVRHKRSSSGDIVRSGEEDEEEAKKVNETSNQRTLIEESSTKKKEKEKKRLAATDDRQQSNAADSRKNDFASEGEEKLIVMKLSTFGKDFKLRLKRNVDFQQRIKDMKMFMAESTKDGQLRYTEIKSGQHKQEPHKRSAQPGSEELLQSQASEPNIGQESSKSSLESEKNKPSSATTATSSPVWNIGSTYHDEDNLAALLIDHDSRTGQLQVDGTIGNDFVIKPMPQSTLEALKARQRQEQSLRQQQQASGGSTSEEPQLELRRRQQEADQSTATTGNAVARSGAGANASAAPADPYHHDDPHDDDEMFLDEDEALELAHLHSGQAVDSNRTSRQPEATLDGAQVTEQQPRSLSKAASERKWRKYRKLMAQTQVPKPGAALSGHSEHEPAPSSTPTAAETGGSLQAQRARRHAAGGQPEVLAVSHHIVYKQRPSSEGSSAEHQRSFLASPGDVSAQLEQLALSFAPQRLSKRSAAPETAPSDGDNMIDNLGRLVQVDRAQRHTLSGAEHPETDLAADPLDGQFYLEPGSMTGSARAGHADWSLVNRGRAHLGAPYAINASAERCDTNQSTPAAEAARGRYKRQAPLRAAPQMRAHGSQVRRKRQAPDTVWPEVLLVVDYDSFLLHGGDSRDVKRYFVSFWNGVDLRYKLLVHPHIRISLAGMIVAKDRDATPYLERNRLRAPNADAVDAAGALTDMGKYLYREDRLPTYDLAVVITKLDMCRRRFEGGRCNRGTAGFAYVGGACVVNKRLEKVNSVAIIEDSGGFSGIIVAAHEVGHLLGCVHDGSPPPSYLGGPGATHCPWEDGFIMSDLRHTERGFRWSQCSVEQFKHFLNGETATCLYNYPHESQMLHRLLPGTMLSLDEQCKRDRGTNACFKDARVCAQLFCFDSASGYCVSYRPAAEGSPCGEGQVCRNGKCVGEIENIIPDYTHQSQTVVAAGRRATGGGHSGVARLADNGLSASSTSTATSSLDGKLPVGISAVVPPQTVGPSSSSSPSSTPQISSRMDTFAVDTPSQPIPVGHYGSFGGRYSPAQVISNNNDAGGLVLMRQAASSPSSASTTVSAPISTSGKRSAKLTAATTSALTDQFRGAQGQYQQRSGHQAIPKIGANQSLVKASSYQHNYPHTSTSGGGGASSASTMSYHQYPSSSSTSTGINRSSNNNNNLLTNNSPTHSVASSSSSGSSNSKKPYDNQRAVVYQPQEWQQYQGNLNHPVNRIVNPYLINSSPEASASEQLYSSLTPRQHHHHHHQIKHKPPSLTSSL